MCVVYALDTKLNQPVAVKFLSEEVADATARRRFQQEARMASSLNHPDILTVYDAGVFAGREYLVTEFVDGSTTVIGAALSPTGSRKRNFLPSPVAQYSMLMGTILTGV